jgi:hypothetical protein
VYRDGEPKEASVTAPVGWVALQGERGEILVPAATVRAVEAERASATPRGGRAPTKAFYHRWRRNGPLYQCACGMVASKTEIDRGVKMPCDRTTDIGAQALKNRRLA